MPVSWAAASHTGLRRPSNEDSYCVRPDLGLFVVADGMGGHVAGEIASREAVEAIELFVEETVDADVNTTWPFTFDSDASVDGNRLRAAFRLANERIASATASEERLRGMATTASAMLIRGTAAVIAHVGDSRVYMMRRGSLQRLTSDHSWVEEQVRAGALTPTAARQHPWRNVVTRALSGRADLEVDLGEVAFEAGDRVLLCSDGLFSVLTDERVADLLGAAQPLDRLVKTLVAAANEGGGPDNITVVVLEIDVR